MLENTGHTAHASCLWGVRTAAISSGYAGVNAIVPSSAACTSGTCSLRCHPCRMIPAAVAKQDPDVYEESLVTSLTSSQRSKQSRWATADVNLGAGHALSAHADSWQWCTHLAALVQEQPVCLQPHVDAVCKSAEFRASLTEIVLDQTNREKQPVV